MEEKNQEIKEAAVTSPAPHTPPAANPPFGLSNFLRKYGLIIGAAFLAVVFITIGLFFYSRHSQIQELQLTPGHKTTQEVISTDVGLGTSTKDDPKAAVAEAVNLAKAKLAGQKPTYAYVVFTTGFADKQVQEELIKDLDPTVKIHGLTSSLGIMTNSGFLKGPVGAVAVLLVASPNITFGVSGTDLTKYSTPQETGRKAILEAIKDAGKTGDEKPNIIIMNGTPRRDDDMEILDGIAEIVGQDTPIIGGTAGNETNDPTWRQITRQDIFNNGLLLTVVYTNNKIGWSFESGFKLTDKGGIATKTKGRVVYEIDGLPALDVYSSWLGPEFLQKLNTLEFIDMAKYTALHPLGRVIRGTGGQIGYYTLHPVPSKDNLKDKSLSLGGPVPQGSELKLFSSSWQTILSRAESIPSQALLRGNLKAQEALFGLLIICRGAYLSVPETEQLKIPLLTNNVVEGMPFIGVISRGEQGPLEGIRNTNANLVESMVIFGK
jgi:hypothetical protein